MFSPNSIKLQELQRITRNPNQQTMVLASEGMEVKERVKVVAAAVEV